MNVVTLRSGSLELASTREVDIDRATWLLVIHLDELEFVQYQASSLAYSIRETGKRVTIVTDFSVLIKDMFPGV